MASKKLMLWLAAGAINIGIVAYLLVSLLGDDNSVYLVGNTSDGHHQIELACNACHVEAFGGKELMQDACVRCHGDELAAVDDSHPKSKFTDPRNADRVEILDARYCITCHIEHKPEQTRAMGVTLPNDYCYRCHHDIAEDRPSHKDLGFESCATAGCHNYHDNAALYEDFLVKHAGEPATLQSFVLPRRNFSERWKEQKQGKLIALTRGDVDAPAHATVSPDVVEEWVTTAHAKAGVNCSDCHTSKGPAGTRSAWIENPTFKQCTSCHDVEVDGFLAGKHGMRLAQNLAPMRPESARLPMQDDAHGKQLGCASCHNDHRFDVQQAAVDSCLGCHADDHSLAYKNSPHYKLWRETSGKTMDADTGVSCSTCHLPREVHGKADPKTIVVQHNQNLNLRPNEKMIRGVCMQCHGLGFSIDALADEELVKRNFRGKPGKHIESIDWAVKRVSEKEK